MQRSFDERPARRRKSPRSMLATASYVFAICVLVKTQIGEGIAAPFQSALDPAGIQAKRILDLWHLTLTVCCVVFAAILIACLIALLRAPRAGRETPADISSTLNAEPRMRRSVIAATVVSVVLLFGLVLADVLTDRALSRLPG